MKRGLLAYGLRRVDSLKPDARNARTHSADQIGKVIASIREFGFTMPLFVTAEGSIVAGHARHEAAEKIGLTEVPTLTAPAGWSAEQLRAYMLADNQIALGSGWDDAMLKAELEALRAADYDIGVVGFDDAELKRILEGEESGGRMGSLAEQFGVPPFSVLSARDGWWQDRKRAWLALGIQSELGRGENAIGRSEAELRHMKEGSAYTNTSGKRNYRKPNAVPGSAPMPLDRAKNRKANATPGGSKMPAANYSKRQRGDGKGRPVDG